MRALRRERRAPGLDTMRERVSRYASLAARFARPSMLRWVKRYPQIINHQTATLQQRIEVRGRVAHMRRVAGHEPPGGREAFAALPDGGLQTLPPSAFRRPLPVASKNRSLGITDNRLATPPPLPPLRPSPPCCPPPTCCPMSPSASWTSARSLRHALASRCAVGVNLAVPVARSSSTVSAPCASRHHCVAVCASRRRPIGLRLAPPPPWAPVPPMNP
jgi:hypothetical protein